MVDALAGLGLFFFLGMILAPRFGGATGSGFNLTGGPALLVMTVVAVLLLGYFIVTEAALGATLGKLAAGIRVQTTEGQPLNTRAAIIRNLVRIIDVIGVYLVGAISVLVTERKQRLGDLAADTVVVRYESGRVSRVGALITAILVAIGGVIGSFWLREAAAATPAEGASANYPTLDQYAPQEATAAVNTVSLSSSENKKFDPTKVGTEFAAGVKQVVVWYRWEGAEKDHRVDIHWFHEGSKVLEQGEPLGESFGNASWLLEMAEGSPLPAGNYEVKPLESGKPVTTIPFRIGVQTAASASGTKQYPLLDQFTPKDPGAAIKAVSLSSSESNRFDPAKVGTEFGEGVQRMVVLYRGEGAKKGQRVAIRWSREGTLMLEQEQTLATPAGIAGKVLLMSGQGPLPAGSYQVELLEDAKQVTTIPFRIVAKSAQASD